MGRGTVSALLPWLVGAGVVVAGWVYGYDFWDPPSTSSAYYETYFDLFVPGLTLLVGLPVCLLAGALVGRGTWRTASGWVLLGLAAVVMSYLASMAFFGGFCIDPGEACITNWPSRIFALLVPLACLNAGLAVQLRRTHRA
jgi:hypothetical protein